jgi:hypothetical protein
MTANLRFRRRLNLGWIRWRIGSRCDHEWTTGDRRGHRACGKCGVWRWYPVTRR